MHKGFITTIAATSLLAVAGCKQAPTTATNATQGGGTGAPTATAGGAPIDGTWKTDLATLKFDRKPDQLLLKDGTFSCPTCIPPLTAPADGALHPVSGRPYADHISFKVVDASHVTRVGQKNGRTTGTVDYSLSADRNTLTIKFTDSSTPNAKPVTGSFTETRVGPAPPGAHAISGAWKPASYEKMSDEGLTATFREENGVLHMSTPSGQGYDAKLDGSDTPIKGDIAGTTASVKKIGDNVYQETDKRAGKVIDVMTMTIGADGKMRVKDQNPQNGAVTTYVASKQ
jgi:hypothetical protein